MRDFVGQGRAPGPVGASDESRSETQRLRGRFPSPTGAADDDRSELERLQRRYPLHGASNTLNPGEKIKGNLFFGGAGMDGAYIKDMVRAFALKGIALTPVDPKKWSAGTLMDATIGVDIYRAGKSQIQVLLDKFQQGGTQFNLIGYSYGSLAASQVAIHYGQGGTTIDNLVLIGSPIGGKFLQEIRSTTAIKNVLILDLDQHGDPLYAGMSRDKLILSAPKLAQQMLESSGHFYYAPDSAEGKKRRDGLAHYLHSQGLR